ncbi:MAG TPA: hypothetical protein VGG23_03945, partial [Acidimicrobiales bacterium]
MNIIAKQIERSNVAFVFRDGALVAPEPAKLFPLYPSKDAAGSMFSDSPSTATRVYEFPAVGLQWVFEPGRVLLEDKRHRTPDESKLAVEAVRVLRALDPGAAPAGYGFNYDMICRMDSVIPAGDIMESFLKPELVESVRHFGWQYTLEREKGRRLETYFLKAVSPIEFSVHANFHFNDPDAPKAERLEELFER